MRKLPILLLIIIFLSSCSHKMMPETSSAPVAAKETTLDKEQFPWYQVVMAVFLGTVLIISINNEQ